MRRVRKQCEAPKRSVARSTPTLPTRAQREVARARPKKYQKMVQNNRISYLRVFIAIILERSKGLLISNNLR
ncbi:MAG: hypothetical protein NZ455_04295 [Bacteroidia bacterium]|nr:hypothetical protein [Bacteroidia bacterium]MDW8346863.1 hypothetical protein [Bacteroidia bacterium]